MDAAARAAAPRTAAWTWSQWGRAKARDGLEIKAENIKSVTIDPKRAKVDCNATVTLESDGPVVVTLLGCASPRIVTR
jgi:hypothetical protein